MTTAQKTNGHRRAFNAERIDVAKLFDRLPPHEIEAEMSVLGGLILDPTYIGEVAEVLNGACDFYKPAHSAIYQAILDLWEKNESLDIVSIKSILASRNELDQAGGVAYLTELIESTPGAVAAPSHARRIREAAKKRQLIEAFGKGLHDLYATPDTSTEIGDRVEAAVFAAASKDSQASDTSTIGEIMQAEYDLLEQHDGRAVRGLETGYFELDEMLSGLQAGQMIVIAGRPGMGKTCLAMCMAERIAIINKNPTAFFSLEMSKGELGRRVMSSMGNVPAHLVRRNQIGADDFRRMVDAIGVASESPLYIQDVGDLSIMQLRAKARRLASRYALRAVFIDYLQLMTGANDRREEDVSSISRGIKGLAKELGVPVVVLSQLNRKAEEREGNKPRMSDLRESGSIEQDADVVMLIHRQDYYDAQTKGDTFQPTNIAEVIIAKQRSGPTGTVKLQFDGSTSRFNNLAGNPALPFGGGR